MQIRWNLTAIGHQGVKYWMMCACNRSFCIKPCSGRAMQGDSRCVGGFVTVVDGELLLTRNYLPLLYCFPTHQRLIGRFLIMPVMVLIAAQLMPKWSREKIIFGVNLAVAFLAHFFLMVLTRPSAANKNFPYHVRTSQIGVMANTPQRGGAVPNKDTDNFSSNPYAPTPETQLNGAPNFSELFTVSNTRTQMTNGDLDKFPKPKGDNPFVTTR